MVIYNVSIRINFIFSKKIEFLWIFCEISTLYILNFMYLFLYLFLYLLLYLYIYARATKASTPHRSTMEIPHAVHTKGKPSILLHC